MCISNPSRGLAFAFGSFQSFYELDYIPSSSASSISWIGTIQTFLLIVGGFISGPLFDIGFYRVLILLGSFLAVFGIMMLSLATKYYEILLSQGICMGLGFGLLYVPNLAFISRTFSRKRALALGVATSGAPLGGIIYTLMFEQLISKVGFAWTVRIIGFVMLVLYIVASVLLLWKRRDVPQRGSSRKVFDPRALKDLPFWTYTIANCLLYLGYMVPFYYMPTFAETKLHTSRSMALDALIISQASSIIGRVVITAFAHNFGSMIPWIFCGAVSSILCLSWIAVHDVAGFIVFSALYGSSPHQHRIPLTKAGGISGGLIPLPPSVFSHVCPDPSALGTWLGMAQSIGGISNLIGPPIAGALASIGSRGSANLNFVNIQLFSGIVMISGAIQLVGLWFLLYKMRDKKGLF